MLEEVGQEDVSLGTKLNSGPFLDHPSYLQRSEEQPPPPLPQCSTQAHAAE